jgi:hypothetical protein
MDLAAGEVAVIDVALLTVNEDAAVDPKLTAVAFVKLVPVIITLVPPATGPLPGAMAVTVGGTRSALTAKVTILLSPEPLSVNQIVPFGPAVIPTGSTVPLGIA